MVAWYSPKAATVLRVRCNRPVAGLSFGIRHYCSLVLGHVGPCRAWEVDG